MNLKNSQKDLEAIFIDVRKAYRLIYVYQRMVLDIIKFIGDLTMRRYEGGWSKFSNSSPKDGKGSLDLWAWDWLNMYCYEFYLGEKHVGENCIGFSIWLVSDTGYYDTENIDKRDVHSFKEISRSETKLVFVVGKNTWHSNYEDTEDMLRGNSFDYVKHDDNNRTLIAKSYKLSQFSNADNTREIIKEFAAFCNANAISEFVIMQ